MKNQKIISRISLLALIAAVSLTGIVNVYAEEDESPATESAAEDSAKEWWEYADADWAEDTVSLDTGIDLAYVTIGPEEGEPIVLIHGATDSRLSWAQVAPSLAEKGFRVYVPELRGHGKTDKPDPESGAYSIEDHVQDILAFLDAAEIKSANVAGHSLGSLIAQKLAAEAPDRVKSIILLGSGADLTQNPTLDWVLEGDGETFEGVHGYDKEKALPDDFIKEWTATTNEDEDFAAGIYAHAKGLPYEDWDYIFEGLKGYDNTKGLADIKQRVLIIWGTGDEFFSADDQKDLKKDLVNAQEVRYEEIKDASHNVHWDSQDIAEEVSALIADFVSAD